MQAYWENGTTEDIVNVKKTEKKRRPVKVTS